MNRNVSDCDSKVFTERINPLLLYVICVALSAITVALISSLVVASCWLSFGLDP